MYIDNIYIYIYIYTCVYMYIYICIYMYLSLSLSLYMYIYIYIYITTGLVAFYSRFFSRSSPHVDRCSNHFPWEPSPEVPFSQMQDISLPEATKRATSVNVRLPLLRKDLRTGSISQDIVSFPSELCRRRSGMFPEVARLVPPGSCSE